MVTLKSPDQQFFKRACTGFPILTTSLFMYACKRLQVNFRLRMQHIYFQEWLLIVFNQLLLETFGFQDKAPGTRTTGGMRFHHGTLSGFILHICFYCRGLSRIPIAKLETFYHLKRLGSVTTSTFSLKLAVEYRFPAKMTLALERPTY